MANTSSSSPTTDDYRTRYYIVTPEDLAQRRMSENNIHNNNTFIPTWRPRDDYKERNMFLNHEDGTSSSSDVIGYGIGYHKVNDAIKILTNSPAKKVVHSKKKSKSLGAKGSTVDIQTAVEELTLSPVKKSSKKKQQQQQQQQSNKTVSSNNDTLTNGLYTNPRRHTSHAITSTSTTSSGGSGSKSRRSSMTGNNMDHNNSSTSSIGKTTLKHGSKSKKQLSTTTTMFEITEGSKECLLYQLLNINPQDNDMIVDDIIDEEQLVELIVSNPILCSYVYRFDSFSNDLLYPLHMACCLGLSYHTIKKCYKAYPNAIEYISSPSGMNCLHYACMYTRASLKVIHFLLHYESTNNNNSSNNNNMDESNMKFTGKLMAEMKCTTHYQRTPLHYACMNSSTTNETFNSDVILLLTETYPHLVMIVDSDHNTPLHIACSVAKPSIAIVEDLTTVNPHACFVQTKRTKSTPLHVACGNTVSSDNDIQDADSELVDIIKDLIQSGGTESVQIKNKKGSIPLFVAIESKAHYKVCKWLAKKYPDSLLVTNQRGQTPYRLAKYMKLPKDVVDFLYPYEESESTTDTDHDEYDYDDDEEQQENHYSSQSFHTAAQDGHESSTNNNYNSFNMG